MKYGLNGIGMGFHPRCQLAQAHIIVKRCGFYIVENLHIYPKDHNFIIEWGLGDVEIITQAHECHHFCPFRLIFHCQDPFRNLSRQELTHPIHVFRKLKFFRIQNLSQREPGKCSPRFNILIARHHIPGRRAVIINQEIICFSIRFNHQRTKFPFIVCCMKLRNSLIRDI